jgi:putative ABC transport system permease protein
MTGPRKRDWRFWKDVPAEVDDELTFHLQSSIDDLVAGGMSVERAREVTLARFGDVERVRAQCETIDHQLEQTRRRASMWASVMQDLRYAARALRRNPGFTVVAVLTLALGIGANTAIFSVVNGVLLRPLPWRDADRLVRLYTAFSGSGETRYSMSRPEFMDYKGLHVFENAAAFTGTGLTLTGGGEPERVRALSATRDLLPVLGAVPMRGRNFEGDEGRQGTEPVVILSHEYWMSRFAGDAALLNTQIVLNDISRRVIGIMPPGLALEGAQAIIPLYINPDSITGRSSNSLSGIARLRPGVALEQAQRELDALTRRSRELYPNAYPASMGYGASVFSMHDEVVGDVRPALLLLLGAVGLVLLIACANVANLLLARGEARQREIAVRLAIGAGRRRVIRQLLTESTTLALLGAAVGTLLAWWALRALIAVSPTSIPRVDEIGIDLTVGLVTLGVAMLTGVIFGLAPALRLTRSDLSESLKEGARGGSASTRHSLGHVLVVGELALAVIVVVGAALLGRSFSALRNVEAGFDAERVLVLDLSIPAARYDTERTVTFYRQLVDGVGQLPGVRSAALISEVPPVAGGNNWDILIDGRTRGPDETLPSPQVRYVSHAYFRTLSIPTVKGRLFAAEDRGGSPRVAVINATAARVVWGDADPVGQRVRFGSEDEWITIVGVSGDTRSSGLNAPPPAELFVLHEQLPAITGGAARTMYLVAGTTVDPLALAPAARGVVRELDPQLAITAVTSLDAFVAESLERERFSATLLGAFGAAALLLAAIGIYGIMSYGVKRRTRELGIRMALGAQPRAVMRLVLRQGMVLAASGLALGVVIALMVTRLMERLLFGIAPSDPLTYLLVSAALATVALGAIWVPARRALRTDPAEALRVD